MADNELLPAHAPIIGVGPRLKAAREESGLTLAQISQHTKIPERMLVLIEAGNFGALPARTYATGFTRSYARTLGLDEREFVAAVRHELGLHEQVETRSASTFEPGDPARVPSARFAWLAAVAALMVVAAGLFLWRTYYAPAVTLPPLEPDPVATLTAPVPVIPPADLVPTGEPTLAPSAVGTVLPAAPAPRRSGLAGQRAAATDAASAATPLPGTSAPATQPLTAPVPAPASTAQN